MAEEVPVEERVESLNFKTEVQQLLNILAHSLYTNREIFLRELLSNASDALHRVKFEMLTQRDVLDPGAELAIHITFDKEANTLTVSDSGIGMTRAELVENLGTIAHSGAMAFLRELDTGSEPIDIIGQFGVGFYSVFMVAEEVEVTTRSYLPEAEAWTWISQGENSYTLRPAEKPDRGTTVTLKLREDADEFLSTWRLEQVIKRHSDYISFPIYLEERVVNQQSALWRQPASQVEEEQYEDFYRQLTLDTEKPLLHLHLVTDAPVHIRSILYVPSHLEMGPLRMTTEHGLRLYSKKILIQENNQELLPDYLGFVEGVVDSEDIPLNISRETVQSNRIMRQIQRSLTNRVLRALEELAEERPDDYRRFWEEFGAFIKQGVATDLLTRDDLLPLLRFHSSKSEGALTSLSDYVERMQIDQPAIYYILGEGLSTVAQSPHLDYFKEHNLEVLYLVDPLDGVVMQSLPEFEEKPLQNVDSADLDLPEVERPPTEEGERLSDDLFETLLEQMQEVLGERVAGVRASKVLRDSPCRLVSAESDAERNLQRVRRMLEEDFEVPPRILEVNRTHPLMVNLAHLVERGGRGTLVAGVVEQLFANQLLLEGIHPNPSEMVPRIQALLEQATEGPTG
ncbi:MAG: molecular chaperone HtpG [Anaerolineales bacterium]